MPQLWPSALKTAAALFHHVFWTHVCPKSLRQTEGAPFSLKVWLAFFKLLNVQTNLSSGYHPQRNGQSAILDIPPATNIRRTGASIYLGLSLPRTPLEVLPPTLTSFQCVLGFQPVLFPCSREPPDIPAVDDWFRCSEAVL